VGRASRSDLFSSLLGVPESQRSLVEASHAGGFMGFIRASVREVLAFRPIADNYFWRGYIRGQYSMGCCPEYLKPEQAERLRTLTDRLSIRTGTVTSVLEEQPDASVSHFVMLDHQDWMAAHAQEAHATEWSEILRSGRSGGSVLLRSANRGRGHLPKSLGSSVVWDDALAQRLHTLDRVGTYASFHVGRLSK
jgi:S-adenosylmethionine-diacylglycerol 3-amino-3-carboxypropyl transferase